MPLIPLIWVKTYTIHTQDYNCKWALFLVGFYCIYFLMKTHTCNQYSTPNLKKTSKKSKQLQLNTSTPESASAYASRTSNFSRYQYKSWCSAQTHNTSMWASSICVLDHDSDSVYANYIVNELQGKSHFILLAGKMRNQSHCDKETGQGAHRWGRKAKKWIIQICTQLLLASSSL